MNTQGKMPFGGNNRSHSYQTPMPRGGQSGPKYPNISRSANPIQEVRNIYRQPQEDAYKMQPTPAPMHTNEVAPARAMEGRSTNSTGVPKRDRTETAEMQTNMHARFVQTGDIDADPRK